MEKQMFEKGMGIRRDMFGAELADKAWAAADDFNRPLEELVNQYCFGEIWGRPGLDRKTRSIVTLSMLTGLNRPNQIRAHVKGALANGVSKDQLDWLIPHQANIRIIEAIAKRLALPMERVIVTIGDHGNTSAASVPLALDTGIRDGRIQRGQLLLLEAFGGGFTWGSALVRY